MTRGTAFRLVDDLADARVSCALAIDGESGHCSVHVRELRLDHHALDRLIAVGAKHGATLLIDDRELRFVEGV